MRKHAAVYTFSAAAFFARYAAQRFLVASITTKGLLGRSLVGRISRRER